MLPDVGLAIHAKNMFFDRPLVEQLVSAKSRRALSRIGGTVRTIARRSMRRSKHKVSAPGEPPRAHRGDLRDRLWYALAAPRTGAPDGSVVIGPLKFNRVYFAGKHRRPVAGTVPSVLEFGGAITLMEVWVERAWGRRRRGGRVGARMRHDGMWVRADLRSKRKLAGRRTRFRTARVGARPYMGPAMAKALPTMKQFWSGSLRAA